MKINETLRKYRKQNHLTQDYVAQELNVSRKTVSSWENGRSTPSYDSLMELAKLFTIPVTDLMDQKELSQMNASGASVRTKMISFKRNGYISKYAYFVNLLLLIVGTILFVLPFKVDFLWLVPLLALDLSVIILYEKNWQTITTDKPLMVKICIVTPVLFISLFTIGIALNWSMIRRDEWIILALLLYTMTLSASLVIAILFPLKRMTVKSRMKPPM